MTENGGEISVGQRLGRIEARLDNIETHLDARITRHKERNDAHFKELAATVVTDFGKRLIELEKREVTDDAVAEALEKYQAKQTASFRWGVGLIASIGLGNLVINYLQGM